MKASYEMIVLELKQYAIYHKRYIATIPESREFEKNLHKTMPYTITRGGH